MDKYIQLWISELRNFFSSIESQPNASYLLSILEVETSFGCNKQYQHGQRFGSNINYGRYERALNYLDRKLNNGKRPMMKTINTNTFVSGVRASTTNGETTYIQKTSATKNPYDIPELELRTNFKYEVPKPQPPPSDRSKYTRYLKRYSYILPGLLQVDISEVSVSSAEPDLGKRMDSQDSTCNVKSNYEVEVELLKRQKYDDETLQLYVNFVIELKKVIFGTENLYTVSELKELNGQVNLFLMGGGHNTKVPHGYIDRQVLTEARNLRMSDLVIGGIVGGPYRMNVTYKTDGKRKMLIWNKQGLWLVFPPYEYNLVSRKVATPDQLTIIDGELIEENSRLAGAPTEKYWYQCIDLLVSANTDTRTLPWNKRTNTLFYRIDNLRKDSLIPNNILIERKTFKELLNPDQAFDTIEEMLKMGRERPHKIDGLMFTPINNGYYTIIYAERTADFPQGDLINGIVDVNSRCLTEKPDICKWKPPTELTIDFSIKHDGIGIVLQVDTAGHDRRRIPFAGDRWNKFDMTKMVKHQDPMTDGLRDDVIVEYAWDFELRLFYPKKIRHEKSGPNREDVAIDVWNSINNPIYEPDLTDRNFKIMFRVHNDIKRSLLKSKYVVHKQLDGSFKSGVLLDIGGGRGGDVGKWQNFDKVILVETDEIKFTELAKRVRDMNMLNKIAVLHTSGGDYSKIIPYVMAVTENRGVDVVSMQDSLTFFWKDKQIFENLVKTITGSLGKDGYFLWKTMDGDMVRQAMRPALGGYSRVTIERNGFVIETLKEVKETGSTEIAVTIPGSIMGERQIEYLTRMSDLLYHLGYVEVERKRIDEESFMREDSRFVSSLYSYGIWHNSKEPIKYGSFYSDPSIYVNLTTYSSAPTPMSISRLTASISTIPSPSPMPWSTTPSPSPSPMPWSTSTTPSPSLSPISWSQAPTPSPSPMSWSTSTTPSPSPSPMSWGQAPTPSPSPMPWGQAPTPSPSPSHSPIWGQAPTPSPSPSHSPLSWGQQAPTPTRIASLGTTELTVGKYKTVPTQLRLDPKSKFVKISTLGEGVCLAHAILTCISEEYRNSPYELKRKMGEGLRKEAADKLIEQDIDSENTPAGNDKYLYWETILDSVLLIRYAQDIQSYISTSQPFDASPEKVIRSWGIDYLYQVLDSRLCLGDEAIGVLSALVGIDIYILECYTDGLHTYLQTSIPGIYRPAIFINYNPGHYEAMGVLSDDGQIKTVFSNKQKSTGEIEVDPILTEVRKLFGLDAYNLEGIDVNKNTVTEIYMGIFEHIANIDVSSSEFNPPGKNLIVGSPRSKFVPNRIPDIWYRTIENTVPNTWGESFPNPILKRIIQMEPQIKVFEIHNLPFEYYTMEAMKRIEQVKAMHVDNERELIDSILLNNARFLSKSMATIFEEQVYNRYISLNVDKRENVRQINLNKFGSVENAVAAFVGALRGIVNSIADPSIKTQVDDYITYYEITGRYKHGTLHVPNFKVHRYDLKNIANSADLETKIYQLILVIDILVNGSDLSPHFPAGTMYVDIYNKIELRAKEIYDSIRATYLS